MRPMILVLLTFIAACATSPAQNSRPVPAFAFTELKAGYGSATIKRDSGFMGAACKVRVFANGTAVGELGPSEQLTICHPPGDHVFGANAAGICGGGTAESGVALKSDDQKRLRIASGQAGDLSIQPTAL